MSDGERDRWGEVGRLLRSARRLDADVEDELRFHLEGRIDELERDGWSRRAAREEVLRRFGDVEGVREACRALDRERARRERRGEALGWIGRDARYALRTLRRSPMFTAMAVLTLGLGIGATTAVFSVVDAVLLRPLPFPDAERLVAVFESSPAQGIEREEPSPPNFADWRRGNGTFEGLAAWSHASATTSSVEPPEVLLTAPASANLFQVLGVQPVVGRVFLEGEEGEPLALLSHGLWQRMYGGDPDVVGRTVELGGSAVEIIGVLPDLSTVDGAGVDVWRPVDYGAPTFHRQSRYLFVVGRLQTGVAPATAQADLDRIQAEIAADFPEANEGWRTLVVPAHEVVVGDVDTVLLVVFGAVGFVLLIACANVANLLLGRAAYREREMAVRAALGAGRGRLRAQLLTESVVLGALGGGVGALLAWQLVRLLVALEPGELPRMGEVAVDLRVLAFALAVSVGTGILSGMVPARRAGRVDVAGGLKEGGRGPGGREGTRRALVVAEVAVS
ncbi:MAG: ABC transporter permease, partial [Gemmatimonadetes bacterium]|nr:ABC transporter permease [Gemmatimonadota bacterium]